MFDLFPQNVAVAGVTREVFDREQIGKSQIDVAEVGVCSDVVEVEFGSDNAGTLAGHFEFGDHVGHGFYVIDDEAGVTSCRASAACVLGHSSQDVLKPDPFSDGGVLEQSDRGGHRRDAAPSGISI